MPDIIENVGFPLKSVGGDRATGASAWRKYFDKLLTGHVVPDAGNELQVMPQGIPNKSIYVDTGAIFIIGAMLIKASAQTLSIADNVSGNTRIDRIVGRINFADRKVELVVKQGTPSSNPIAPSLVQNDSTYYEVSLAKITLANGFSTITSGNITDERDDETVCGYSRFRVSNATASIDGLMSATDKAKIDGIESGAKGDQTGTEIKSLYEAQSNTNAYSDTEKQKVATNVSNISTNAGNISTNTSKISTNTSSLSNIASTIRDTVLTGLSTASSVAITVADTILSALGKLQSQITSNKTKVDSLNTVLTQEFTFSETRTETGTFYKYIDIADGKSDYVRGEIYISGDANYNFVGAIGTLANHLFGIYRFDHDKVYAINASLNLRSNGSYAPYLQSVVIDGNRLKLEFNGDTTTGVDYSVYIKVTLHKN